MRNTSAIAFLITFVSIIVCSTGQKDSTVTQEYIYLHRIKESLAKLRAHGVVVTTEEETFAHSSAINFIQMEKFPDIDLGSAMKLAGSVVSCPLILWYFRISLHNI